MVVRYVVVILYSAAKLTESKTYSGIIADTSYSSLGGIHNSSWGSAKIETQSPTQSKQPIKPIRSLSFH